MSKDLQLLPFSSQKIENSKFTDRRFQGLPNKLTKQIFSLKIKTKLRDKKEGKNLSETIEKCRKERGKRF
jgi:hypothetical protein